MVSLPGQIHGFAHSEKANRCNGDFNAVEQLGGSEGKARLACLQIDAYQSKKYTEGKRDKSS